MVCFGSFQDYLGKNTNTGGIKAKNEWVHATVWDCIIFDEYHFGAWRENAKDLFGKDLEAEKEIEEYKKIEKEGFAEEDKVEHLEKIIPISTNHYLYLSTLVNTYFFFIIYDMFILWKLYKLIKHKP